MNLEGLNIKKALFPEWISAATTHAANPSFDIILDQEQTLEKYCIALLEKILSIPQSQFPAFINYQTDQIKDPQCWLNKFEKLVANNEELFVGQRALSRYNKLYNLIEKKRTELQSTSVKEVKQTTPKRFVNAETEDRYFSFHEVKQHVETLETFGDKIIYLSEEVFEYRQADIISINNKLQSYDEQCNNLMEKLQTMRKLRLELEKEQKEKENQTTPETEQKTKLQLNGPINIITNAFKQMMVNVKPNGTPYLPYKIKDIAQFIGDNFIDENGQPISQATLQTYLSPNRTDKDPNSENTIKL